MTNYKIVQNNGSYDVVETQTNQVVYNSFTHAEAKKMMRHLNLGGSFDGWTPTFFTKSFNKLVAAD